MRDGETGSIPEQEWLTIAQAAKLLGMAERQARRWADKLADSEREHCEISIAAEEGEVDPHSPGKRPGHFIWRAVSIKVRSKFVRECNDAER